MRSAQKMSLLAVLIVLGFQPLASGQDTDLPDHVSLPGRTMGGMGRTTASAVPQLPPPKTSVQAEKPPVRVSEPPPSPGCFFLGARSFTIPFTVDEAGAKPTEVQLFASRGSRSRWRRIDAKPAATDVKEFQYNAHEDGEFWFATRTIDSLGRAHPNSPIAAQLKVYIDTSRPQIQLDAEADASGRVDVVIKVQDSTPATLQLRYVTDAVRTWQNIDVQSLPADGRLHFTPKASWDQLSLQLIATDAAKNQSVVSKLMGRPRLAVSPESRFAAHDVGAKAETNSAQYRIESPQTNALTVADPVIRLDRRTRAPSNVINPGYAPNSTGGFGSGLGGYRGAAPPASRQPITTAVPKQEANGQDRSTGVSTLPQGGRPFGPASIQNLPSWTFVQDKEQKFAQDKRTEPSPDDTTTEGAFGLNGPLQSSPRLNVPLPQTQPQTDKPARPRARTPAEAMRPLEPSKEGDREPAAARVETIPTPEAKPEHEAIPTPKAEPDPEAAPSKTIRRGARKPVNYDTTGRAPVRFSNSQRFSLEYELESIGNTGIDSIELYGSTDGGKTWKFWGKDPDQTSPFDIETKDQGAFGFRIVVVGRNGLTSPRPLPGESPDIVVVVDRNSPIVRISGARYGEGDRTGALVIRYECQDDHLVERPVTLAFSNAVNGPWTTIAAGLKNEGGYLWPADPGLPRQFYLRLDAKDRAGNVGTYILDRPIDAQGLAPRARIRGFQTLSGNEVPDSDQKTATRPFDPLK